MIIHCCGQSVTCGVENVTASCLCFRVVKLLYLTKPQRSSFSSFKMSHYDNYAQQTSWSKSTAVDNLSHVEWMMLQHYVYVSELSNCLYLTKPQRSSFSSMLSRSYDNPLLRTICHMWSGECYSIMFMFQSCQTVWISLNHKEVHSVNSKWVTMILMLSRRYDNPLLWTICHMWSGECYSIMFMFFRVVKLFVSH
jgi:hypothetical protein